MSFATTLRAYRRRAGLNRVELTRLAGLTDTIVSRYENGVREPSIQNVHRLAAALELDSTERMHLLLVRRNIRWHDASPQQAVLL